MLRNRSAEKDIRDYLSSMGYQGKSARFEELELHAIQRPGWLQVFRFSVRAKKPNEDWVLLFGALKDDERFKLCEVRCFQKTTQRSSLLEQWSQGLTRPTFQNQKFQTFGAKRTVIEMLILVAAIALCLSLLSLFA